MARRSRGELARLRREIAELQAQVEAAAKPPIRVTLGFDPTPLAANVRARLLAGEPAPGALARRKPPIDAPEEPAAFEVEAGERRSSVAPVPPAPPTSRRPSWVQRAPRGPLPLGAWRSQRSRAAESPVSEVLRRYDDGGF